MDQLKGSLRFIPLSAVTQFVAGLGSTGHLKISQGNWSGYLALHDGQIFAAELGSERGRAALEGMVLALTDADFVFADAPVEASEAPLLNREELGGCMAGLVAERERLDLPTGTSLNSIPCLIDQPQAEGEASQITIQSTALQLIPALVHGLTLEQIGQRRGLARTLREIAMLRSGGLVRLEAAPASSQPPQPVPAPVPAARAAATVRPLRPVPTTQPSATPAPPARRTAWPQATSSLSTAPATAELPRPHLVTEEHRPRLEPVRVEPADGEEAVAQSDAARGRRWHHSLMGFFVAQH